MELDPVRVPLVDADEAVRRAEECLERETREVLASADHQDVRARRLDGLDEFAHDGPLVREHG